MSEQSSFPKYPESGPTTAGGDEGLSSALRSDGPLPQPRALALYLPAVLWMCLEGLPLVVLTFPGGPVTGLGTLLVLGGQLWLFTQIFAGNPAAALVVLWVPVVGPCLAIRFMIDHWSLARWPLLCQGVGVVLWVVGLLGGLRYV